MSARSAPRGRGEPPLEAALRLIASGQALLAGPLLDEVLRTDPRSAEAHRLAAIRALSIGDVPATTPHARRAVELAPQRAELHLLLGRALKAEGDLEGAAAAYRAGLARDPALAEAHVSLGITLKAQGRLSDAIACYRAALAINPRLAVAHANLGNALMARAASSDASVEAPIDPDVLESQSRAVALDPSNATVRRNWGLLLERAGRREEAVEHLNAALGIDPGNRDTCIALCNCLARLGWYESARNCLERWLAENPPDATMTNNLVTMLLHLGHFDQGWKLSCEAQRLAPGDPEVVHNAAMLLMHRLDPVGAIDRLRGLVAAHPRFSLGHTALMMSCNYVEEDPRAVLAVHRSCGPQLATRATQAVLPRRSPQGQRLRVGLLSGDLRRHSVAYFMEPLIAHYDRSAFELVAYHNSRLSDEVSARLQSLVHGWVPCATFDDAALAARVRADRIDVLVDLSGHTAESRPAVLAARAAPMQVTYLGYPTSTGVPNVDFRISDTVIDPPGHEHFNTETLLRMPNGMFCYRPDFLGEARPATVSGANGITFGSFNVISKISRATVEHWAAVLHRVPHSRLFLKTRALSQPETCALLLAQFADHGVDASRIVLNPWRPDLGSHLELYGEIDVALDTYPYNGATTTCEALWMGVPVVTRRGATHTSRMGASLLTAIGRPGWISDDLQGFADTAAALAADAPGRAAFRRDARAHLRASPLMDEPGQAVQFGRLLLQAWEQGT